MDEHIRINAAKRTTHLSMLSITVLTLAATVNAIAAPAILGAGATSVADEPKIAPRQENLSVYKTNDAQSTEVNTGPAMIEYRLVGFTKEFFTGVPVFGGLSGLHAANEACQQNFGRQSRAATVGDANKPPLQAIARRIPKKGWLAVGDVQVRHDGHDAYWPISHGHSVGIGRTTPLHGDSGAGCFRLRSEKPEFTGAVYSRDPASDSVVETTSCAASLPFTCSVPVGLQTRYMLRFHTEEAF